MLMRKRMAKKTAPRACVNRGMRMGTLERESYGKPKEHFIMFSCKLPLTSRCEHRLEKGGSCLVRGGAQEKQ